MSFGYRILAVWLAFIMIFQVTVQPIAAAHAAGPVKADQVKSSTYGDETDTDGDGIPDIEEGLAGTNPENADSDFDQLTDKYEIDNDLDPLDPDMNDDGLTDYQEIVLDGELDVNRDSDNDTIKNYLDDDNDNDGVPDGLDMSPFARSNVNASSGFIQQQDLRFGAQPFGDDHFLLVTT